MSLLEGLSSLFDDLPEGAAGIDATTPNSGLRGQLTMPTLVQLRTLPRVPPSRRTHPKQR